MYLSQQVVFNPYRRTYTLMKYVVYLDNQSVLRWKHVYSSPSFYTRRHKSCYHTKSACYLSSVTANKKVTMTEASKLTGYLPPVCMDYLMETLSDSPVLQNYIKPRKSNKCKS